METKYARKNHFVIVFISLVCFFYFFKWHIHKFSSHFNIEEEERKNERPKSTDPYIRVERNKRRSEIKQTHTQYGEGGNYRHSTDTDDILRGWIEQRNFFEKTQSKPVLPSVRSSVGPNTLGKLEFGAHSNFIVNRS